MNHKIIIEALEHFYEEKVFSEYDRGKGGIEYSFEVLRKCIETQQSIIEMKTKVNMDTTANEQKLEKLKKYWNEDTENASEVINKVKEEVEYVLDWIPIEIKNHTERGWNVDLLTARFNKTKGKFEKIKFYAEKNLEVVTGVRPF